MNQSSRVVRETGTFLPLPNDGCTGDRILCLTDVAAWLMCSVEEARDFLTQSKVPCLKLPSGSQRFLLSVVLDAVRMSQVPFEPNGPNLNTNARAEGNDRIARDWERWVLGKGYQTLSTLGEDGSAWVTLMVSLEMTPDVNFALPKSERRKLVDSVQKRPNSLPFSEDAYEAGNPPAHKILTTTTRIRGTLLGRKVFEL